MQRCRSSRDGNHRATDDASRRDRHGPGQDRDLERGAGPHPGRRDRRGHRPRHRAPRRQPVRPVRPLPASRRAPLRRSRARRGHHLRRPRLGLPHRVRCERVQQRRGAREVHERGGGRRPHGRPHRGAAVRDAPSAALRPRRVPGLLPGPAHGSGGAVRDVHPRARGERAEQDRSPRPARRDGRTPRLAPPLGRHPVRHRAARAAAQARRRGRRHRCVHRAERREAAVARHPVVRVRHELRCALAGGEDRARARRRARRHRHLLGRGRDAAGGAGREQPLLLRARLGTVRMELRPPEEGAGVPLQGRPGREDGHRRAPARQQGGRQDRRGPGSPRRHGGDLATTLPGLGLGRRLPPLRQRGARAVRGHPGRLQALGAAHRGGPRRGARGRGRLRDPRRPGRRDRSGAAAVPRPHLGPDDPRARSGPRAPRPPRAARRDPRDHRWAASRARLREGAGARRRCGRGRELGDPGDRLPRHARVQHQQLPGRHRDPAAAPARPAPRRRGRASTRPLPARERRADAGARTRVRALAPPRPLSGRPHDLRPRSRAPHRDRVRRGDGAWMVAPLALRPLVPARARSATARLRSFLAPARG